MIKKYSNEKKFLNFYTLLTVINERVNLNNLLIWISDKEIIFNAKTRKMPQC